MENQEKANAIGQSKEANRAQAIAAAELKKQAIEEQEARTQELRARLVGVMESGMTWTRICVEAGIDNIHDLREWAQGEKRRTWLDSFDDRESPIEIKLRALFSEIDQERIAGKSKEPEWIETPTGSEIIVALELTRNRPTMSVIEGSPGIGKTKAIKHYLAEVRRKEGFNAPVWHVTANENCCTSHALLHLIAEQVARDYGGKTKNDVLMRELIQRMDGTGGLLIIDEAQHMDTKEVKGKQALNSMRTFYDQAGIGIAYVGSDEIYKGLNSKGLAQLSSRIGYRLAIKNNRPEDVEAVMQKWRIFGRKEREFCIALGTGKGGLRDLTRILNLAVAGAQISGQPLSVQTMAAARDALERRL